MKIILASKSPFRRQALEILGLEFEVIPSDFDEKSIRNDNPKELAKLLAEAKAKTVGNDNPNSIIIASDLFIVYNNKIYEKPKDLNEAREQLKTISGKTFEIISGLAVFNTETKRMLSTTEICNVKFRELTSNEIDNYINKYPVTTFSGSFDADGLLMFVDHVNGNYNFRSGLPVNRLIEYLRENDVKV